MASYTRLKSCLDSISEIGESKRFSPCPICERGKNAFLVTRKDKGWVYWCHRCHAKGFVPSGGYTPKQALTRVSQQEKPRTFVDKVELPDDFTNNIPAEGKRWLYSYLLTDEDILKYNIGYSAKLHRVILPVYLEDELIYWQGRTLNKESLTCPKYINIISKKNKPFYYLNSFKTKPTILVEDIISAIKIHKAEFNALALLGSYIDDDIILFLLDNDTEQAVVWLDPDKRKDMVVYQKRLQTFGIRTKSIPLTEKDPKDYDLLEIQNLIEGV